MINVNVISGFLGAGKTTFIKMLIEAFEGEKLVILENEFGEIGIDSQLIEGEGLELVELASGCICCTMKVDFERTIEEIAAKIRPDRIIVEPTGVGMLKDIKGIMQKDNIKRFCSLQSCITIVDAVDYLENADAFGEFFKDQVESANSIVLSKTKEAGRQMVSRVARAVAAVNPQAPVIARDWKGIERSELAMIAMGEAESVNEHPFKKDFHMESGGACSCGCSSHSHTHGCSCESGNPAMDLTSVSLIPGREIDLKEMESILDTLSKGEHGSVIRAKGFAQTLEGMVEFSYVGGRYAIDKTSSRSVSGICIIGKNLDEQGIKYMFCEK